MLRKEREFNKLMKLKEAEEENVASGVTEAETTISKLKRKISKLKEGQLAKEEQMSKQRIEILHLKRANTSLTRKVEELERANICMNVSSEIPITESKQNINLLIQALTK